MAVDGSITINTNLETGDAEKDLVALHGSIKKAASAMESIGRSSQRAFESARLKVDETKLALERLEQKEREIQAQKIQEFSHMPFSRNQLHEAVEASLASDKEYKKLQGQIESTILNLDKYSLRMDRAKESGDSAIASLGRLRESMAGAGKEAVKTGASTKKATKDMKKMKDATIPLSKSLLTVGRMFKLMLLRMVIRATIQAVRQGFRDLAQYSAEFNRSMSALSTATLQARNSLTTAFAPALQAITPMILNAVNALVSLFNMMGMLSARVFGNATTFTKAKKAQVDYAKSVAGTNKAAKEQLAAFDELNVLSNNQGANAGVPSPAEMFEEVAIPENVMTLGDTLRSAFEGLVSMLGPAKQALQELWGELQRLGGFAWEGLKDFYELFLKPVGSWILGEGLPRLVSALSDGLAKVNWERINSSLQELWEALAPFAINVGEGLLWLWENVLVPIGTWTMNEVVPRFLDLLAAGLDALNAIIGDIKPGVLWLWNNLLHPIAKWTGGIFISIIDGITKSLSLFSDWARNNRSAVQNMTLAVGGFFAGIWLYNTQRNLVSFMKKLSDALVLMATKITVAGMASIFTAAAFGTLAAGVVLLVANWEKMSDLQKAVTILSAIAAAATAAAVAIALFHTSWSVGVAAAAIAAGIVLIGGVLTSIKDVKVPSVKAPNLDAPVFEIPKLATGAVIPPNAEFLAILGDQKHGRNIEAPEGLIRQIIREEMDGMGGNQEITIRFDGTMSQFVRSLKPYIDQEGRRQGRALIQGA